MSTYAVPTRIDRPAVDRSVRVARPVRSAAPRSSGARPSVRLTRRGRIVVLVLALGLMLGLGLALGAASSASDEAGPSGVTETIRVGSGDTLWDIAAERTPEGQGVQATIDEIRSLNAMDAGALQAGQLLLVPAGH